MTAAPPRFAGLLGRFALAGLAAGTASGLFAQLVTERAIAPALALEQALTADEHSHEEMFGRTVQQVGGFLGTVVAAVVFAVVLAAVYALVRHRLPGRTDTARTAVLAAVGFAVLALLPAVKVPANPPGVGDPQTFGTRTALYGAVLLAGVLGAVLVGCLTSVLRARGTGPSGVAVAASALVVLLVAVVLTVLPDSPVSIPADVPAALVWNFRLASLGQLAVLWSTLGLVSGWLLERMTAARPEPTRPEPTRPDLDAAGVTR